MVVEEMTGAKSATASMTAPTVRLTSISEAWKRRWKKGSNGCVQYTFRNVQAPAIIAAKMADSNDFSGRVVRDAGVTTPFINP